MTGVAVRRTAGWMQQLDDRILEFLADSDWSTPRLIAQRPEFGASEARVRERCRALRHAGLIHPFSGDCYELTTWGQLYLAGDLDAAHQPRPSLQTISSLCG